MNTGEIILFIALSVLSLVAFIMSYFQFNEKGFLLNNAYIYASKKEREAMNKTPYYRQSAIVFLLIGIMFLTIAMSVAFYAKWLYWVEALVIMYLLIYAIASSINIEKKNK